MAVTDFQGPELLPTAFAGLLSSSLPAIITQINAAATDGIVLADPAQYLDYLPSPSTVLGGTPIVACGEADGPSRFQDDLVHTVTQEHPFLLVVYHTTSDHQQLAYELRRYRRAIKQAINTDRLAYPDGQINLNAQAWGVRIIAEQPGPLLADMDPLGEDQPPKAWLSWSALAIACRRTEVGG